MKKFSLLTIGFFVMYCCASLRGEEQIKYHSPDGAFALRILYSEDASGNVETGVRTKCCSICMDLVARI